MSYSFKAKTPNKFNFHENQMFQKKEIFVFIIPLNLRICVEF
jgi:hypothetical protein